MAGFLFIRVRDFDPRSPQAARFEWVRVAGDRLLMRMAQGTLEDLPQSSDNEQVVVVIPGSEVLLTRARLPGGNRHKLLRAAPYAIEDQLIGDVEDQHVALGERGADGRYALAVVARDYLATLLDALEQHGLLPHSLLPDFLCLPCAEGTWSVLLADGVACVRQGPQAGFACDAGNLASLLGVELAAREEAMPARLELHASPDSDADSILTLEFRQRFEALEIVSRSLDVHSVGEWLALSVNPAAGLNLLQGAFARETAWQGRFGPWRAAAAVFVLWLVVQGGFDGYRYYQLREESEALRTQMEQVFKQAFPASRIVRGRLREYMAQLVTKLRQGSGSDEFSLAQMLSEVGPALSRSGVAVQSIQYREGRLDLRLQARDLASIDKLKQVLAANGKWQVESETTSRGGKVDSVLHIREKA